jgi:hypothetical protein
VPAPTTASPAPKRSTRTVVLIAAGGVLALLVVIGAIAATSGSGGGTRIPLDEYVALKVHDPASGGEGIETDPERFCSGDDTRSRLEPLIGGLPDDLRNLYRSVITDLADAESHCGDDAQVSADLQRASNDLRTAAAEFHDRCGGAPDAQSYEITCR